MKIVNHNAADLQTLILKRTLRWLMAAPPLMRLAARPYPESDHGISLSGTILGSAH